MKWIKLKSIELENFRQFKEAKIEFSTTDNKPFSIIEGKNGFGKSNILNAITWCFYGLEEHLKNVSDEESEPIINTNAIVNIKDNERVCAKVTVFIATDERDIKIERSIWGKKYNGKFHIEDSSNFHILERDGHNWNQSLYPTVVINRILPQIVMKFFFFKGEELTLFFENISQDDVKNAIFDISQVTLIDLSVTNLEKLLQDYRAEDKNDDPRLQSISDDIDFFKKNIKNIPDEIKKCEEQKKQAETNIDTINSELRNSSIDVIKEIQKSITELDRDIQGLENDITKKEYEYQEHILEKAPLILSKKTLQKTLQILSKLELEGELPPKIEDTFIQELIDKKKCICGTDLTKGHAKECLEKILKERKLKEGVSTHANALRYSLISINKDLRNFNSSSTALCSGLIDLKDRLKLKKDKLLEKTAQREKFGKDNNEEEIQKKESELREFKAAIEVCIEKIAGFKINLREFEKKLKDKEDEYEKLSKNITKNKEILHKREFITKSKSILVNIKKRLVDELRLEIEKNTENYFRKIVSSKKFKEITIDENYKISVIKDSGYNTLKSLSVGETLLLGLSFMAALRKVSGFIAPVIIDTPLAPIDKDYRINMIEFLSTALEDTQIILLMKDTEYTDTIKSKLDKKTGVKKLLKHNKVTGFTEVEDYE